MDTISDCIKVGNVMLYVYVGNGNARKEQWTISKIGRKWITFTNGKRADKETLKVDGKGYSSPGSLWFSEEEFEAKKLRSRLWRKLIRDLPWSPPGHMTEEKIRQIAEIARIDLGKGEQ